MDIALVVIVLLGQIASLGLLALILHKVRRIHRASYRLVSDAAFVRGETGALFGQLQALRALDYWMQPMRPLPPMRGWAASPDFLACVAEHLVSRKPAAVLECSSGVSTLVCARIMQRLNHGHVYSLEHDPDYTDVTRRHLAERGLENWATVVDAPLTNEDTSTPWYSLRALPEDMPPAGALLVDGPPGPTAQQARYPALPQLHRYLAPQAMVFVDDADREDERNMLQRWQEEFPDFVQREVPCEKGCKLLERVT